MRTLTVRWPWSALILMGVKDVENRGWRTPHRGPLTIHEAQKAASPVDIARAQELVGDDDQWEPILHLVENNRAPGCVMVRSSSWMSCRAIRPSGLSRASGTGCCEIPNR
jgi:hypothetical protein